MTTPTIAFPVRLSEKYRPRKVAEFVGLPKAKRVLSKFVAAPYPRAFLFFGPPGWARLRRRLRWPKRWARSFIIVVPQLFHQQPFAPHRIENLQEQHPQQPLRSIDGRPTSAYRFANCGDISFRMPSTIARIGRSG